MKVFILTREINEYDQDGEYFVKVFGVKPTYEQLLECGVNADRLEHTLNGGGRIDYEEEWFFLREYEC